MNAKRLCYYLENILNIPIYEISFSELDKSPQRSLRAFGVLEIPKNEAESFRKRKVTIKYLENGSCYGIVSDDQKFLYFAGPVQFAQKHVRDADVKGYYCEFHTFITTLLLLREYLTGETINYSEFAMDHEVEEQYQELMEKELPWYQFQAEASVSQE